MNRYFPVIFDEENNWFAHGYYLKNLA